MNPWSLFSSPAMWKAIVRAVNPISDTRSHPKVGCYRGMVEHLPDGDRYRRMSMCTPWRLCISSTRAAVGLHDGDPFTRLRRPVVELPQAGKNKRNASATRWLALFECQPPSFLDGVRRRNLLLLSRRRRLQLPSPGTEKSLAPARPDSPGPRISSEYSRSGNRRWDSKFHVR